MTIFGFDINAPNAPQNSKELLEALEEAKNCDWVKSIRKELDASNKINPKDLFTIWY